MIIEALNDYYEILASDVKENIPQYGYSSTKVDFALNLSADGELKNVIPLKIQADNSKQLIGRTLIVPEKKTRSSGISAHFMCDNSSYFLGVDKKGKPQRSKDSFKASKLLHTEILSICKSKSAEAVMNFFNKWEENLTSNEALQQYTEEIMDGGNLIFKLDGERGFIHDCQEIKDAWENYLLKSEDSSIGQCSITGKNLPIARLHPYIKNVRNAQSSGASITSFNDNAYESYGKKNGFIAPVSERVAFNYTTVLNHMLLGKKQKIQIGDSTTVFWAESNEKIYVDLAAQLMNPPGYDNSREDSESERKSDKKTIDLIRDILDKTKKGEKIKEIKNIDERIKFYVLGLSPNASRISVRFFYRDTFGSFIQKISQHYIDMEIDKASVIYQENIPIWQLVKETISPNATNQAANPLLAGELMRSIINGTLYPALLFNAIMGRIKTDMDSKEKHIERVNYIRVSIIKAYLIRKARIQKNKNLEEVLTVSLNTDTNNTEYLLGRLFAVLEKAQQDANPGINATIKDRYFSSACGTPASVFPILLKLAQHHISKSDYGRAIDKKISEIMDAIPSFPSHLSLEQQGLFVLGYYHQRNSLYTKNRENKEV